MDKKKIGAFFNLQKVNYTKCMHDVFQCKEEPVRAHSIQNSAVMDLLQKDNHVLMPRPKLSAKKELTIELALVGRNNASTFTGLCSRHDNELFKLIDTEALDVGNDKQLDQLALRASMREMHTCLEQGFRMQAAHIENVKTGVTKEGSPDGPGVAAIIFMKKAWHVFRYQGKHFEREPSLAHQIIELDNQAPTIAAASLFSVAHDKAGNIVGPMLSVLPLSATKTVSVVSYPKSQEAEIKKALPKLFDDSDKKKALSELILQRVENFALAPATYDSWTVEKKKAVLKYFGDSMLRPAPPPAGVDLSLF
jgi:hypothetical protein